MYVFLSLYIYIERDMYIYIYRERERDTCVYLPGQGVLPEHPQAPRRDEPAVPVCPKGSLETRLAQDALTYLKPH